VIRREGWLKLKKNTVGLVQVAGQKKGKTDSPPNYGPEKDLAEMIPRQSVPQNYLVQILTHNKYISGYKYAPPSRVLN